MDSNKEADGAGMIHGLLEMYQIKKAYELRANYHNKKWGKKKAILKGIDFVQSICAIKDIWKDSKVCLWLTIWKAFIQSRVEFLLFKKAKEITVAENLQVEKEVKVCHSQMEVWDNEAKLMAKNMPKKINGIDTE